MVFSITSWESAKTIWSGYVWKAMDCTVQFSTPETPNIFSPIIRMSDDSGLKSIGMVAQFGEVFCDNQKDKNDWKVRMLKAGLGNSLSIPDDWEELSEEEKQKRLDKVIDVLRT